MSIQVNLVCGLGFFMKLVLWLLDMLSDVHNVKW